MDQIKTY